MDFDQRIENGDTLETQRVGRMRRGRSLPENQLKVHRGFVPQEDVELELFQGNRFGRYYALDAEHTPVVVS
jgi:hypothetical protein